MPGGIQEPTSWAGNHLTPLPLSGPPLALGVPAVTAATASLATSTLRGRCPSLLLSGVGGSALQIHRWQEPRSELLPHHHDHIVFFKGIYLVFLLIIRSCGLPPTI